MPSSTSASTRRPTPPVFHPDHPHNRPPLAHAQTSPLLSRNLNLHPAPLAHSSSYRGQRSASGKEEMSDSDFSSPSPIAKGRCFCGKNVGYDSLYCSVDCARSDAFSSLCYKPAIPILPAPPLAFPQPSLGTSISAGLSRNPSTRSSATTSSQASYTDEWTASHYRRMAHADMRRDERREERRRRRAEGSVASSTSSSRVPDLVGGGASHSRNHSIASSATSVSSVWSAGMGADLSRNPSAASSASSSRRYGAGVHVDTMIMEDDEEEEWLSHAHPQPAQTHNGKPYGSGSGSPASRTPGRGHKRRHSRGGFGPGGPTTTMTASKQKKLETSFGMGKDMRDVLEEIISMEKEFMLSDGDGDGDGDGDREEDMTQRLEPGGLFTASFDRPPRTPSPVQETHTRASLVPPAPPALHARRASGSASGSGPTAFKRPPSLVGLHQSSLSESHTALYLATASPAHARRSAGMGPGRRSASPALEARRSITFDALSAGPAIASLAAAYGELPVPRLAGVPRASDSPASTVLSLTPQRRRPHISPHAVHPSMDGWRFPSPAGSGSAALATPTKRAEVGGPLPLPLPRARKTSNDAYTTPQHQRAGLRPGVPRLGINTVVAAQQSVTEGGPHLLWPPPARPLAPALFPYSPAGGTPDFGGPGHAPRALLASSEPAGQAQAQTHTQAQGQARGAVPPSSGLKLGVLLGSGSDVDPAEGQDIAEGDDVNVDLDVDMDMADDDSTAHGHGGGIDGTGAGYLPVFLEAEGFRAGWRRE